MAAMASPIPVLPEVPSMMVPPGFSNPAFSASSIIFTAILSLMELPGLKVSTFANTVAFIPLVTWWSLMRGVFPMDSRTFSQYFLLGFWDMYQSFYKSEVRRAGYEFLIHHSSFTMHTRSLTFENLISLLRW